jgi:molecular chaperone HtpG
MAELKSNAEHLAETATKLPEFRNLNLGGVKDQVAEILSLIGRVEGIFSTYTKHDISHIDTMLAMLDWLVPPSTKQVMTPVDWLMTVFGIYLHDLGMVVTSAEFLERQDNQEFRGFLETIEKDPEAKDYRARAGAMNSEEKDRFFYQEFVRLHHAARIREWVTGRHSRSWGDTVEPISREITKIMERLPSRFRENLAVVCESHHKNNLDKTVIYPLAQRYGNHEHEIANVQYSALLLRTVDLIHVTKDRTPSVMYQSIRFSDLKSIDEWDKQIGTFSVHMRSREFDPSDLDSHVIEVNADFTEERPFFALTEYLSWADSEIRQSKQWADISQQKADGKGFSFPWRAIRGDIRVEGNLPRQMRFELDRGRLLDLLVGHTIYNEPTVAVRELLQNAIDAVRFQYYLDERVPPSDLSAEPSMGHVIVKWNAANKELIVEDNGIGMDLSAIENHLLRVGASFYDTPQFHSENQDFSAISRFGIGILTCFMISDNIEIITCRAGEGRRIRMTSVHADYLLKDLEIGAPELEDLEPHGTRVRLTLRPSVDLEKKTILDIVRQWVILPACEVLYSEPGMEEQTIGLQDIAEAARSLYFSGSNRAADSEDSYDVVTITPPSSDSATYEIAFLVERGRFPERSFTFAERGTQTAAVCIEGIRADWHLPGFSTRLCAVLSVRNNKRFRTTVSRDSLETDEEYMKVGILCADALLSYIRTEVERISNLEGQPLSQASTGGRVIFRPLLDSCGIWNTFNRLTDLYMELPLVVVEETIVDAGKRLESRQLHSLKEIAALTQFWTIESRTVDYLGIISRDLGRELNISSFLGRLAPELYEAKVNPIVVDAEGFSEMLLKSHSVVEITFSRRHQRTLLRWEARRETSDQHTITIDALDLDDLYRVLSNVGLESARDIGINTDERSAKKSLAQRLNRTVVGNIIGDVEAVHGVRTRIIAMLQKGSEIARLWTELQTAWMRSGSATARERSILAAAMLMFTTAVSAERHKIYTTVIYDLTKVIHPWRAIVPQANSLLEKLGVDVVLPPELQTIIGVRDRWFDATTFWRDWAKLT